MNGHHFYRSNSILSDNQYMISVKMSHNFIFIKCFIAITFKI